MRAFSVHGDELQLGLADVPPELQSAVGELGFGRAGAVYVRRFPGDARYAARAAERFELVAERMVGQAGGLEPAGWESALETLCERGAGIEWSLVGSAVLAVRGKALRPRHVDSAAADCAALAAAVADLLVEPVVEGSFRAFAEARIECRGRHGTTASVETVLWRGHKLRVGVG